MNTYQLWEVFIREGNGLSHKHIGSVLSSDAVMALDHARDVYARRNENASIWVIRSSEIIASDPKDHEILFESSSVTKPYRYAEFYHISDEIKHL